MAEKLKHGENEVNKEKIVTECQVCGGTGVMTNSSSLSNGVGMVCPGCNGEGSNTEEYIPFQGRKIRKDIQLVKATQVSLAPGVNPVGEGITYEEFLAGKRPTA
jgi:DnaJ-class molecular chaperone